MEKTATTAPQQQQGRFAPGPEAREPTPPPPAAPPADLAAQRMVGRRWPRTVPEKRVFPRS